MNFPAYPRAFSYIASPLFSLLAVVVALAGCVNRDAPAPEPMYYQHSGAQNVAPVPSQPSGIPSLPAVPQPQPQVQVLQPGQPMPTDLSVGTTAETLPDGTTILTTPAPSTVPNQFAQAMPSTPQAMMPVARYQSQPAHPSFTDIPMPVGFELDQTHTIVFTSTTQSVGKLVMNGKADQKMAYDFYLQQMPAQGWKMVNAFQGKSSSLYFARPGTFAAILIEPVGRSKTQVTVNIGPE